MPSPPSSATNIDLHAMGFWFDQDSLDTSPSMQSQGPTSSAFVAMDGHPYNEYSQTHPELLEPTTIAPSSLTRDPNLLKMNDNYLNHCFATAGDSEELRRPNHQIPPATDNIPSATEELPANRVRRTTATEDPMCPGQWQAAKTECVSRVSIHKNVNF